MCKPNLSKHKLSAAALIVLIASFLGLAPAFAQPSQALTENWRATDFNFSARMMDTDSNQNTYVLGDTVVGDYVVIKKYDPAGVLLWQKTYDPAERLRGVWITVDSNGNAIALASMISGSSATPSGWLTLKYDANGNLLWANSLSGPYRDARRVAVDIGGNIYVAGRMWLTNASGLTSMDSVLIKYAPGGTTAWTAVFDNGGAVDEPFSLAISLDGARIAVAGSSGNMFMALMYDANGNRLWANTNTVLYAANDVAFRPNFDYETYFATGSYSPQDPNPYQMAIVKFDAAGNQTWARSYSVGDRTLRLVAANDGVVAAGIDSNGYLDWMTIKTDYDGNLLWSQRFDGAKTNDEIPEMLAVGTFDHAVYVTGKGGPNPSSGTISNLKGVVAKYSANGAPQWAMWDDYAGGKAVRLDKVDSMGAPSALATLGWGYLVAARYTQTGLPDLPPAAPANLVGQAYFTGVKYQVNLSFTDNASNEFWVEAERCQGSGCTNFAKVAQTLGENGTGLSDANVARGATYAYRVRAVGFVGASDYSNTVEVAVPPLDPPTAAPSNLTATMSGANVALNWQDNSTNETQFYIERCQGTGCTNFIGWAASGANTTAWTDLGATAGQSYSYRVRAWNIDGYSPYSNVATVVTSGGLALPAAPGNLIAQALSGQQIKLSWTNNTTNQDGIKIERCRGSSCTNFAQIASVVGSAASYTDSGLQTRTTYRYRIRSYNAAGDSPYSNIASAITPRR